MAQAKKLPARPNLQFLKKLARERLQSLRRKDDKAKLASAQLEIAREYGFASWRQLHAHVERIRGEKTPAPTESQIKEFFDAINRKDLAAFKAMLEQTPALADAPDPDGTRPLHIAADKNQPEMISLLLAAGADVQARFGRYPHTPLSWAITCQAFDAARELMSHGAKPDLFSAAGLGDVKAIRSFFDRDGKLIPGASTTGSSRYADDGALLPCPPTNSREIIADALCMACRQERADAVRELLKHNPDLTFRAYRGGTALHWAYFAGNREIIDRIVAAGADPKDRNNDYSCTPRAFGICAPANWGFGPKVQQQLQNDPSLVNINEGRGTPLHEAARNGNTSVFGLLLVSGADLSARDSDGNRPIDLARKLNQTAIVQIVEKLESTPGATRKQFRGIDRPWTESHALIEKYFNESGSAPRWESIGLESPKLLERQADEAILKHEKLGLFRIISVWHISNDNSLGPTRSLEFFNGGDFATPPTGGNWRRIHWQPSKTGFASGPGRTDDLHEAMSFLENHASAGTFRVITVRRMLLAKQEKNRIEIGKSHASAKRSAQTLCLDAIVDV